MKPDLAPQEPEISNLSRFLNEFNQENNRGASLVAASFIDERLKEILMAFLIDREKSVELFSGVNAPLGTFSSRISTCYALGLIQDNEYEEITIVRKIRNEFGHTWDDVDFDQGRVGDLCRRLPWLGPAEFESGSNNRARFNAAVAVLLSDLLWRVRLVSDQRRVNQIWPNKSRNT